MKLVITTRRSFGDKRIVHRGIQFRARFVKMEGDTYEDEKALREFANAAIEDARDLGYYLCFDREEEDGNRGGREKQIGEAPLTPRERALKAQLNSAQQLARNYKEQAESMRKVLIRNGLAISRDI